MRERPLDDFNKSEVAKLVCEAEAVFMFRMTDAHQEQVPCKTFQTTDHHKNKIQYLNCRFIIPNIDHPKRDHKWVRSQKTQSVT